MQFKQSFLSLLLKFFFISISSNILTVFHMKLSAVIITDYIKT
jgi:hypothetical protein